MIVVLWGVSGCGKSTVGKLLAGRLGWEFYDADDFHPESNIEKMRRGIALEDADRYPWLDRLAGLIRGINDQNQSAILACSALKEEYRKRLGINHDDVRAVHLCGPEATIQSRLSNRSHEFMSSSLLASQFATLEPSTEGLSVDISSSPEEICVKIMGELD